MKTRKPPRHPKRMVPLRKPLILTFDELQWISGQVSLRYDDLNRFYQRGTKGQKKLREALNFHAQLRRKLWNV